MAFSIDPHIEDRSYLTFQFKKKSGDNFSRVLKFLENIEVSESTQANYAEYTPIGSNGSIFAFLGAKSRKLDLKFSLTLPNIQEHTLITPRAGDLVDRDGQKAAYFVNENLVGDRGTNGNKLFSDVYTGFGIRFFESLTDKEKKIFSQALPGESDAIQSALAGQAKGSRPIRGLTGTQTALYQVMYWINLIRTSVLTSAKRPFLGPPIITLNHGLMYMSVPCICEGYKVSHDEAAGYDAITFLPRKLNITMDLREVRLRGLDFEPGNPERSNFMPGWDSLYNEDNGANEGYITLDPYDLQEFTATSGKSLRGIGTSNPVAVPVPIP